MLQTDLIKVIDSDIEKHHSKASEMLSVVQGIFILGAIILFVYIAPSVSERALPDLEETFKVERVAYVNAITAFKAKYNSNYIPISEQEYKNLTDKGTVDEKIEAAWEISTMPQSEGLLLVSARFIAKLKVEDAKIEFVLKLLPYVIGAVLAGFLVTYRLHVISAKELAIKKFDILAQTIGKQDGENG